MSPATIQCSSCSQSIYADAAFCCHCGAKRADAADALGNAAATDERQCPRCNVNMHIVTAGTTHLHECPGCAGIWADVATLAKIRTERTEQVAVLQMHPHLQGSVEPEQETRYLPCPACGKLMNRVNFARRSNIIVDICKQHGTWFDKDELQRIIEFLQANGVAPKNAGDDQLYGSSSPAQELENAGRIRNDEIEARAKQLQAKSGIPHTSTSKASSFGDGLSAAFDVASFLIDLLG